MRLLRVRELTARHSMASSCKSSASRPDTSVPEQFSAAGPSWAPALMPRRPQPACSKRPDPLPAFFGLRLDLSRAARPRPPLGSVKLPCLHRLRLGALGFQAFCISWPPLGSVKPPCLHRLRLGVSSFAAFCSLRLLGSHAV